MRNSLLVGWTLVLLLAPLSSLAEQVVLSLVADSSVSAKPGLGPLKLDKGKPDAEAQVAGEEDITSCEAYGTRSNASGRAAVVPLPALAAATLSYRLEASARANGGHYRTGTCLANRRIGFTGHDTEASVDAVANAVVRIHFDGGRPNVPYFVKISRTKSGESQIDQLTAPDGKLVSLTPDDSPFPVILSKPGQDYFLRATVSATARNSGGCCSDQKDASAVLTVSVEPAPLLFGGRQTGFIAGGRQTEGFKNVAVVLIEGLPHCTATLIAPRTLVTAAHCVETHMTKDRLAAGKVTAVFGPVFTQPLFAPVEVVEVAYPDSGELVFDRKTLRHDIALLYVKSPVTGAGIRPAVLHEGTPAWQKIKSNGNVLIFVGFGYNVINNEKVGIGIKREASWGISGYDDLAISFSVPGTNTCMGDSGGPGFVENAQSLMLAAITSGGDDACTYGFDTRIDAYISWLQPRVRP